MECARYRGRAEREEVDLGAQLLEVLLVRDSEALLLVDDDEAEVLEADVRGEDAVRADEDVDLAALEPFEDLRFLPAADVARQLGDLDRVVGEPLAEGFVVLLREHRRRDEHRDLSSAADDAERRPDSELRLAEADVAAQESIHRALRGEIGGDLAVDFDLIRRIGIGEGAHHVAHELGVSLPGAALLESTTGLNLEQFGGEIEERALDLLLPATERLAADPVQGEIGGSGSDVALDEIDAR